MGCFDRTCALSRTAIHEGDQVLILYWRPYTSELTGQSEDIFPDKSTYEAKQVLRKVASWKSIDQEKYDAEDVWMMGGKDFLVLRGKYNGYGWIETDGIDSDSPDVPAGTRIWPWVLIHEWAARLALETLGDYDLDSTYAEDPILVARYIVQYAFWTRTQLFYPDHLLGAQHYDNSEVRAQIELCKRTIAFLEERVKEEVDDEE